MYATDAPSASAKHRIPLTLLCESAPRTKALSSVKGYASPTSLRAPDALGVNMTVYSSGDASKNCRTAARAAFAHS